MMCELNITSCLLSTFIMYRFTLLENVRNILKIHQSDSAKTQTMYVSH